MDIINLRDYKLYNGNLMYNKEQIDLLTYIIYVWTYIVFSEIKGNIRRITLDTKV